MSSDYIKKPSFKIKCILFPIFILPRWLKVFCAWVLVYFWYYVLKLRISETRARLEKAFPKKTQKEIKQIILHSYYNLIMVLLEYSYLPFSPKRIKKHTELRNIQNYQKHLDDGKAVLLLTGHLANGEIILSRVSLEGYKLKLIGKRVGNAFLDEALFELREYFGLEHIPPKNSMKEILKRIDNKESIVLVNDQFTKEPRGVAVEFLGLETMTNSVVAKLALKTDAVVVPVNMYREKGRVVVDFEPSIKTESPHATDAENITYMTQIYSNWLEKKIIARPHEWMWIHRRWKNLRTKDFVG